MNRVLVCGSRDFDDWELLNDALSIVHTRHGIAVIIHGGAPGADTMAGSWATLNGLSTSVFPAKWAEDGKAAGPRRNQRMLEVGKPDMVVAFQGGRGTADMVRRARAAGLRVEEIRRSAA